MSGLLARLTQTWQRTSFVQRVMLIGVLLACGVAAAFLVGWVGRPDMALLYSKLSSDEAAKIVEKLNDAKTPYELTEGGTSILVPRDKVYSLRLEMASQGLPDGGQAGYELLEKQEFGASPRQIEANYVRAIEGELAKSIQVIEGVELARVRIVQPRSKIFAGEDQDASASVVVKMRGSRRLPPSNVSAIVHLVAGGVESLRPEKVVVVDGRGVLYTGESTDANAQGPANLHRYKAQLESELARKAEEVLERALGVGRAMVRVTVDIERTEMRTTKTVYDKENQVAKKEEILERTKSLPGATKSGSDRENNISTEYAVPETVTEQKDMPGKVLSTTVSAVVDLTPAEGSEDEITLTEAQCKDLICMAVGISDEKLKSESVQVVATKFNRASPLDELEGTEAGWFTKDFLLEVLRRASLGILVLGALLALKILGGKKKKVTGAALAGALPGGGDIGGLLPGGAASEADPDLLRASITRALQENPDEVKRLFLSWVENEKGEGEVALDGAKKAAMFLSWLGPQAAAQLLREAGQETVTRIAAELAYLDSQGPADPDGAAESAREFFRVLRGDSPGATGGETFLREMIQNVVGQDQAPKVLKDVQRRLLDRDPFRQIREAEVADVASALKGESAQIVSLVLSELPVQKSTQLLSLLAEDVRAEAVQNLTTGAPVPAETRSRVALVVMSRLTGRCDPVDGGSDDDRQDRQIRRTALILRGLPKPVRDQMLADMGERDPELRNRVSEMMVVWEDVGRVTDRTLQDALRSVDSRKLALALYEADEAILAKIRHNISERMSAMMEEESSLLSSPSEDDVDDARQPILVALRELNERGELSFEEEDDDA